MAYSDDEVGGIQMMMHMYVDDVTDINNDSASGAVMALCCSQIALMQHTAKCPPPPPFPAIPFITAGSDQSTTEQRSPSSKVTSPHFSCSSRGIPCG